MKSIAVFLTLCFLVSCTMTKRLHSPGWHVEWNSSLKKNQSNDDKSNSSNHVELALDNKNELRTQSQSVELQEAEVGQTNEPTTSVTFQDNEDENSVDQVLDAKKIETAPEKQNLTRQFFPSEPRVEPLGIVSILSGSTALIFFLNICLLLSDNGWNAILGLSYPWLFFITLVFAVIGLILAIKSIKRIRQNPELYKGKARAWTGFGISVGGIGLVVLLLLIIALVFLFETFFYW